MASAWLLLSHARVLVYYNSFDWDYHPVSFHQAPASTKRAIKTAVTGDFLLGHSSGTRQKSEKSFMLQP